MGVKEPPLPGFPAAARPSELDRNAPPGRIKIGGEGGTRRNPGSLRLRGRRLADSVTRAAGADHLSPQTIITERVESKKRFLKSSVVILRSGRALHHAVRSAAFFCDDDFPSDFCLQIAVGSLEAYLKQAAAWLAWPA